MVCFYFCSLLVAVNISSCWEIFMKIVQKNCLVGLLRNILVAVWGSLLRVSPCLSIVGLLVFQLVCIFYLCFSLFKLYFFSLSRYALGVYCICYQCYWVRRRSRPFYVLLTVGTVLLTSSKVIAVSTVEVVELGLSLFILNLLIFRVLP